MNKELLIHAAQELIRELCILADKGMVLSKDKFHDLCERQQFIDYLVLSEGFPAKTRMDYFTKTSAICKPEIVDYINNAFDRHANATIMEDFGLEQNALLFAVNIAVKIIDEANNL